MSIYLKNVKEQKIISYVLNVKEFTELMNSIVMIVLDQGPMEQ